MTIARMLRSLPLLLLLVLASACASAARPQVNVLGVTRGEKLLVEIHNPTAHDLSIQAFDWSLVASGRALEKGTLKIRRTVGPGGSTILELPISGRPVGAYRLDGRLRDAQHADWQVSVRGRFQ